MIGDSLGLIYGVNFIDLAIATGVSTLTFAMLYRFFIKRAGTRMNTFLINSLVNEQEQYIVFFDFSGKVILANKSFEDLVGLNSNQIIGEVFEELPISKSIIDAFSKNNENIIRGKTTTLTYTHNLKRNKGNYWLEIQKRSLVLKNPDVTYILIVATDISDKKKVEERLSTTQTEYKQLVEAAGDIICRTDLAGNISYINAVIKNILGYSEAEATYMNVRNFVHNDDREEFQQFFVSAVENKTQNSYMEFRAITRDGIIKWMGQVVSTISTSKEISGFQMVIRDISPQKEAEMKLKEAKRMAEEASDAKSSFISSMSHEFRTPLNAILGYSQILERNDSLLNDEKDHIQEIKKAGEQLLGMVNDILELSVLDTKNASIMEEKTNIVPFMLNFAQRYSTLARENQLIFKFQPPEEEIMSITADFDKLSLILKNLLENAIKFTQSGSIEFSYRIERKSINTGTLVCEISDTGIGISEGDIEHIFKPFWQKEPLKNVGTGLGLTLCKRLISVLNGDIEISSTPYGTNLTVTTPVKIPLENEKLIRITHGRHETEFHINHGRKLRALIVDDLVPNRTITRIILQENGFDYAEAEDGLEALNKLEEFDADVILMDINMPVMDGTEAMLQIRARDWKYKNCPIIAVTAGAKGGKTELLLQGFSDYIQKPFKEEELINTINTHLDLQFENMVSSEINHLPEKGYDEYSPDEVATYIKSLGKDNRIHMEEALRRQDFDAIKELELVYNVSNKQIQPEFQRLIKAANEYDYLFATNVLKSIKNGRKVV